MTEDEYSEKHLRLRVLEIARPLFPASADIDAMLRAAEKLWEFVNAPTVTDSGESGNRSAPCYAGNAGAPGFKMTDEQRARLDAAELKRMSES